MKTYQFEQQQKQAAMFDAFVEWLKSRKNVIAVILADEEEEKRGIHLWATVSGQDDAIPIQVKVDFQIHHTTNMAVEMVGHMEWVAEWKPGWFSHLHNTTLLVYVCGKTGAFRTYGSQGLFRSVVNHYGEFRSFIATNGTADGGRYWYSTGLIVPTGFLMDAVVQNGNVGDICRDGDLIVERS